ncbi:MAG: glycosyltransferase family 1 protein [Gammaproteobacteria bacterium]|nr:MAG: glycosyltransferase family 1 protein [Gammaproteobacteria bacterium]
MKEVADVADVMNPALTVLYVVNDAGFFLSHRLRLACEARNCGFRVVIVCGEETGESQLAAHGFEYRTIPLSRSSFNPFRELRTYRALQRVYRAEQPDLVHHVTIKPVIYGTRIARRLHVAAVVNAIPGLGFVFTRRGTWAWFRRRLVSAMYRSALRHPNMRLILQNREDLDGFIANMRVARSQTCLIRGAGVDLVEFSFAPEPEGPPRFILVARMLADKGVRQFVNAARSVKARNPTWAFTLLGGVDPGNPASLTAAELESWDAEGVVHWAGHRDDVVDCMREHHIVCLPTYYREGLPKSLLEAAAMGRAMIASDVPGCRDIVRDGVTGLVVPARDVHALADAMVRLGENVALRDRLRIAARSRAEELFSVEDVVHDTFLVYEELLGA